MRDSGMSTDYVNVFPDGKSPVSLAYPERDMVMRNTSSTKIIPSNGWTWFSAKLEEDDIVVFGSYFALNPVLREKVLDLLEQAREKKAIVYYDPNFRSSHKERGHQADVHHHRESGIRQHCTRLCRRISSICGACREADKIYKDKVKFLLPLTSSARPAPEQVSLRTEQQFPKNTPFLRWKRSAPSVRATTSMQASSSGLLKYNVRYERPRYRWSEATWDKIIQCGIEFAAEVCKSFNNSVSQEFAEARKYQP